MVEWATHMTSSDIQDLSSRISDVFMVDVR